MQSKQEVQDADPDLLDAAKHVQRLAYLAYAGVVVAAVVLLVYAANFFGKLSGDPAAWGQFGDYVGGLLNPTFSLLALLALLATLGLQLRELRMSVRELRNSAEALRRQNETLHQQTFEGTFFQLLRFHSDVTSTVEFENMGLRGRSALRYLLKDLETQLNEFEAKTDYEKFVLQYDYFYRDHQEQLGHYFRLLYNIVKLIHRTEGIDRQLYVDLVRAQLSSHELTWLFYNCLSEWGRDKFKPLVEEYAMLKSLPNDIVPPDALLHRYDVKAFGGSYPESWL